MEKLSIQEIVAARNNHTGNKKFVPFLIVMGWFLLFNLGCTLQQFSPDNEQISEPYQDKDIAAQFDLSLDQVERLHTMRGLTNNEIAQLPAEKLARALYKIEKPKATYPGEYLKWRLESLQDENGNIAPDGLMNAVDHVRNMRQPARRVVWGKAPLSDTSQPLTAGIDKDSWIWLGPGNVGGRVRSIVIHPTLTNTMWLGSIAGGIWKSTNGGSSWSAVDDFMTNLAVSTMIMDPTNANVMYAGTGEGFYNSDAIRGAGVFKSTDGGTTWNQLASTTSSSWYSVNRLAINSNGSVLLAATNSGIYRSINGGTSWTQVHSGRTLDLRCDPNNASKGVAAGSSSNGYYTTDAGQTWFSATGLAGAGRVEVAYAPSGTNIVYASVSDNSGRFYRSTDGGVSYSQMSTGYNYLGSQGWYDNVIWVDPTDAATVIVGGIDLYRSTDSGASFNKISQWYSAPASAHADHHFILHHPDFNGTTNTTVFFANDGGIYKTDNVYAVAGTSGWQELNNNLGITQFYGAAGNGDSGVIIGGTQDNGTLRYNGNTETWSTMYGGDGGWCAFDQNNSNYAYGEYVYLQLHRSSNGGANSDYICGRYYDYVNGWSWKSAPYVITDAMSYSAEFIAPFILDPNVANQNRILAGGRSLWKSNDAKAINTTTTGPSWTAIKGDIGSNITAVTVAPGNSNIIWVGHRNGDVYYTTNGTAGSPTWFRADNASPYLPNRRCQRIVIDPNNSSIVYVTFGGFSSDNVYKTLNNGITWTDITGSGPTGLPDAPVRSLVIHPDNSDWLYVGTEVGIFASEDGGSTWSTTNDGPTNCSVDELFWFGGNVLVAATHGRGLFKIDVSQAKHTVIYDGNGNTGGAVPIDTHGHAQGDSVTVLDNTGNLVKIGAIFHGWNTAANGSGTHYFSGETFTMGNGDVTLFAQWSSAPTYTVTYNSNGSSGGSVPVDTNNYEQGDTVTVRDNTGNLIKSGYVFSGWNSEADGSGIPYLPKNTFIMAVDDVHLYTSWKKTPWLLYFPAFIHKQQ